MKEKQILRSTDPSLLLVATLAIGVVLLSTFSDGFMTESDHKAIKDAKGLALQLASGGLEGAAIEEPRLSAGSSSRSPASVKPVRDMQDSLKLFGKSGKIGMDPWKNPYNYRFVENSVGQLEYIVVWSNGPNSERDSGRGQTIAIEHSKKGLHPVLAKDDIGYVYKLPN